VPPEALREVLEVRVHVVVRHEHGVALLQQLARALEERGLPRGDEGRGLGGAMPMSPLKALEADLDGGCGWPWTDC
jgi:hypothetical protein